MKIVVIITRYVVYYRYVGGFFFHKAASTKVMDIDKKIAVWMLYCLLENIFALKIFMHLT